MTMISYGLSLKWSSYQWFLQVTLRNLNVEHNAHAELSMKAYCGQNETSILRWRLKNSMQGGSQMVSHEINTKARHVHVHISGVIDSSRETLERRT